MKRRLYFLLPGVASATRTANDLLLARVEDRHMHFLAKRGTDLGELHEASHLFKTDLVRGAGFGLALGVWMGTMAAIAVPNSRLEPFRAIVSSRHPEVVLSSRETRYPAFP